jgi:stage II sporulation protein M
MNIPFHIDKNIKFYFNALALLFIISGTFGFVTAQQFPLEAGMAVEQAAQQVSFIGELTPAGIFLFIALNNSVKAFFMMLMGILWGVIPVLFILLNGYAIGIVVSVAIVETGLIPIILGTFPHGILEIPAVLLAASYGVWLGEMFSKKIRKKNTEFSVNVKNAFGKFMKVVLPILIIAAFIETFATSWILNTFIP